MDQPIISGIQQIGVGVADVEAAFGWYRHAFGTDLPVFREAAEAPLMTRYTGGSVHARDAILAVNLAGGGGFEIWQYTSRTPVAPERPAQVGDLGILAARIKARGVNRAYQRLQSHGAEVSSGVGRDPAGRERFTLRDPFGNLFQIVESDGWFRSPRLETGGVEGALIGVSDIDASLAFYREVLGFDRVVYDATGSFEDLSALPAGDADVRRVLLERSELPGGPFSRLFGRNRLELVAASGAAGRRLFDGRFWGDLGFIHLCFDVIGMDALKARCAKAGHPFTVDSDTSFDMGEAGGRFAYIEDPDGTLIEFVETHKLPVVKKLGWYLDLRTRDARKPLPNWMIHAMGLGRVRD